MTSTDFNALLSRDVRRGVHDFLSGGSEMAARMRAFDWQGTPLGDPAHWPQSLRTATDILLNSRYPMFLAWGPKLALLYNDGYRPIFGNKDPAALGQPFPEVWAEIWDDIVPLVERALAGEATWSEDLRLFMERRGFPEEVYFTFSYSPVRDDDGVVAGMFCACTETTGKVLGERRLKSLRDLAATTGDARSVNEVCRLSAEVIASNAADVPFALLYLHENDGATARLAANVGCTAGERFSPEIIAVGPQDGHGWPSAPLLGRSRLVLKDLDEASGLPGTPWPEPSTTALILPLARSGQARLRGCLIVGASRRLPFDDNYERFFDLLAGGVTTALANVDEYEAERRRAEALAEIDRAKTAFFSNVSHELRTPLTLMLGPLQDVLSSGDELGGTARGQLRLAHRNAIRLLKLVNSLLDFSRIEARRVQVSYEPTDLAGLTADLASNFRSACEKAGLELCVICPPLPEPIYVDRDMWEKIVLNLVSNAFKFTLDGKIEVSVHATEESAVLSVRDTGVGIPRDELTTVFERFHRVEGIRGRTHEGTGIGLALVHELVKFHDGSIAVDSEIGCGTIFTVSIPRGRKHLPQDRIGGDRSLVPTHTGAAAYVDEALRWLPDGTESAIEFDVGAPKLPLDSAGLSERANVLVADDNSDMREYLARLLGQHWNVTTAADGQEALDIARRRGPALILADVMMPELDGFELLRALRADEETATIPVIMLSARAGEESRVEGIEAGADDYLAKPFSARELIARVSSHLALARSAHERNELLEREQAARKEAVLEKQRSNDLRNQAEAANRAKDEFLAMLSHELRNPLAPILTALELIRLRAGGKFEKERGLIERQAKQLMRLVNDLLDVPRIARGKIELKKTRVELSEVVGNAIEIASPLIEQRAHHLTVDVPTSGLAVAGDAARLAQVVSNLLSNAAKYTEPGGRIAVKAMRVETEAVLTVADNGSGITRDLLPRVFDMFSQERQDIDRTLGGLGLGLTIARSIVELHGGSVSAHSDGPGRGSTFAVRLPLVSSAPPMAAEDATRSSAVVAQRRRRVLLVDDNEDAARALGDYLAASGHAVRVAHDGPAALRIAEEFAPEVALLDIGLPGMDGYELAMRLREQPRLAGIGLIAVTGYAQPSERERTESAGFAAHLVKPVDLDHLATLLENIAGSAQAG